MSGSGRPDNGRGNNRRRQFKRRNNDGDEGSDTFRGFNGSGGYSSSGVNNPPKMFQKPRDKKAGGKRPDDSQNRRNFTKNADNNRSEKIPLPERPKWIPPKINTDPLPVPDCPYCGKEIRDISQAISDKDTGVPVHFDCVLSKISAGENPGKDECITYIGGGRFGIVAFTGKTEFMIKKIIEWENKDKKAEWRSEISERYSVV